MFGLRGNLGGGGARGVRQGHDLVGDVNLGLKCARSWDQVRYHHG